MFKLAMNRALINPKNYTRFNTTSRNIFLHTQADINAHFTIKKPILNQKRNFKVFSWEIKISSDETKYYINISTNQTKYDIKTNNPTSNIVKFMVGENLSKLELAKAKYKKLEIDAQQIKTMSNRIIGRYLIANVLKFLKKEPSALLFCTGILSTISTLGYYIYDTIGKSYFYEPSFSALASVWVASAIASVIVIPIINAFCNSLPTHMRKITRCKYLNSDSSSFSRIKQALIYNMLFLRSSNNLIITNMTREAAKNIICHCNNDDQLREIIKANRLMANANFCECVRFACEQLIKNNASSAKIASFLKILSEETGKKYNMDSKVDDDATTLKLVDEVYELGLSKSQETLGSLVDGKLNQVISPSTKVDN